MGYSDITREYYFDNEQIVNSKVLQVENKGFDYDRNDQTEKEFALYYGDSFSLSPKQTAEGFLATEGYDKLREAIEKQVQKKIEKQLSIHTSKAGAKSIAGAVPFVGDVIVAIGDIHQSKKKYREDIKNAKTIIDLGKWSTVYEELEMYGIRAEYSEGFKPFLSVQPGLDTEKRIDKINSKYGEKYNKILLEDVFKGDIKIYNILHKIQADNPDGILVEGD